MELFKGFVRIKKVVSTKGDVNKKPIDKYIGIQSNQLPKLDEVKSFEGYAGILESNVILVDIDDFDQSEILLDIVDDLGIKCRVYETDRGKHFYFLNHVLDTSKTHVKVACGITIDIKLGCKNGLGILKFHGVEREILYDKLEDEEYDEVPKWLFPVQSKVNFFNMEEGDGRNQTLFNYILTLQSADFSVEECKECIQIINKYILKEPLSDSELEVILREDAFDKPSFFKGKEFLFDKFATYLKNSHHIIKINNQLHMYRDGIYINGYGSIESEMIKNISNLNRQKRTEVMSYLDVSIQDNTKVSPANYIAFKDGIFDIDTDTFQNFDPSIIITNKINFKYNPSAYNETTDKTLNKLACHDSNIRLLLEETIGYCLYRRNELRKSFILIGDKHNGKSTYLDMILTLLGEENTTSLDLNELDARFKTAEMFGKLANIGDDIGDDFIPNPAIFKKLVSGDRVNVERKGRDPFDFNNYSKLLFSANNIPRIKDKSGAVIDRLIIVPFDGKFTVNDPDFDPYIKYKLRSDSSIEYLIKIGLEGLKRVLKNRKFTTSERVQKELEEYEENNNPIIGFFKEVDENDIVNNPTNEVYKLYNQYCLSNNFNPMSKIEFSKKVNKYFNLEVTCKSIKGKTYRIFVKR